jgi:hypothetical protein
VNAPARLVIRLLERVSPETRRLVAANLLLISLIGWLVSHYLLVKFDQSNFFNHMVMAISWWAITLTCGDILSTNDVKADVAA